LKLRLPNFIKRILSKEIPFRIDHKEVLVRGIIHPLFYSTSKKSLKREAFLPPPNECEVSLLRLYYTTENFCKNHSVKLKVNNQSYCGLSTINLNYIETLSNDSSLTIDVKLLGTPLDKNNKYISTPPVFKMDSGLPVHGGLIYEQISTIGAVQTSYRQYASKLAKLANYFPDPNPDKKDWSGEKLKCI
jgi:hypothetical protein